MNSRLTVIFLVLSPNASPEAAWAEHGGDEPDLIFPRKQLSFSCGCLHLPFAPDSQTRVPRTKPWSLATSPLRLGQLGMGPGKQSQLPKCTVGRPRGRPIKELPALRKHSAPEWTVREKADRNDPGRLPRSPRLQGAGINATAHAQTQMAHGWGHVAAPCWALGSPPRTHPSSPVCMLELLSEQAPEVHTGDPTQLPNIPCVAQTCGHARSIAPAPWAPAFPPLPSLQASGGHRPPRGISKGHGHLSQESLSWIMALL